MSCKLDVLNFAHGFAIGAGRFFPKAQDVRISSMVSEKSMLGNPRLSDSDRSGFQAYFFHSAAIGAGRSVPKKHTQTLSKK